MCNFPAARTWKIFNIHSDIGRAIYAFRGLSDGLALVLQLEMDDETPRRIYFPAVKHLFHRENLDGISLGFP
jgi:hypothetical protein